MSEAVRNSGERTGYISQLAYALGIQAARSAAKHATYEEAGEIYSVALGAGTTAVTSMVELLAEHHVVLNDDQLRAMAGDVWEKIGQPLWFEPTTPNEGGE